MFEISRETYENAVLMVMIALVLSALLGVIISVKP
jgi:hypothetical protein